MFKRIGIATAVVGVAFIAAALSLSAGEGYKYESKGKRDPFVSLLTSDRSKGTGLTNIVSMQDLYLEGIALGAKGKNIAIINGEMVKEGDKFGELKIKRINKNAVTVSIGGIEYTLNLSEEGGKKGGK